MREIMIKIAICDDEPKFVGTIQTYLETIAADYHYEMDIQTYFSGETLIKDYQTGEKFDLIYLDIEMQKMDGIETAKWIRNNDYYVLIVYISSHEEYLRQLFEAEPFRFIQKPVNFDSFLSVFSQAQKRISQQQNNFYCFKFGKNIIKVLCRDILYFESAGRKVIVHTLHKEYAYYDKLNNIEEQLKDSRFIRIHKAYLVNIDNIEAFQYERVALTDGTILNISEKNRPYIRNEFWKYFKGGK